MFGWLSRLMQRRPRKESNSVSGTSDRKQAVTLVDKPGAGRKRVASEVSKVDSSAAEAIAEAERSAAEIKMAAEAEAARIISQAKQQADDITRNAELSAHKEAQEIVVSSSRKVEVTEIEARQKALLFIFKVREEVEKEVREEYRQAYSRLLASVENLMNEGQSILGEMKDRRERFWEAKLNELKESEKALLSSPDGPRPDTQTQYGGEVELAVVKPAEPKMVTKLYNFLQGTPDIKIISTSGSWDRGTSISVMLDKPMPLATLLASKLPEYKVTPEIVEKADKGKSAATKGKSPIRRISLARKETDRS